MVLVIVFFVLILKNLIEIYNFSYCYGFFSYFGMNDDVNNFLFYLRVFLYMFVV